MPHVYSYIVINKSNKMYMYFKHANPICADFSNICGVHHMLFAIIQVKIHVHIYID